MIVRLAIAVITSATLSFAGWVVVQAFTIGAEIEQRIKKRPGKTRA